MSDESIGNCILAFVFGGVILFCVGGCVGGCVGRNEQREEAISAGVAEWYLDANADKAFRWKTNHFEK